MRILVTGGAGFTGSHTCDRLLALGHEVVILDALTPPVRREGKPRYLSSGAEFYQGDARNRDLLVNLLRRANAGYHFSAYQDYLPDFSRFSPPAETPASALHLRSPSVCCRHCSRTRDSRSRQKSLPSGHARSRSSVAGSPSASRTNISPWRSAGSATSGSGQEMKSWPRN